MNKKFAFGITLFLLVFFIFAVYGSSQTTTFAENNGLKSYIVVVDSADYSKIMAVLNNEQKAGSNIQQISTMSHIRAISTLSQIKKQPKQQIKQLDIIHGFAAKMTRQQAEKLKKQGYRVYPDRVLHIMLQDSTKQIGATDAWNEMVDGSNLTGNGTIIAILDTGINYTHPDLGNCTSDAPKNNWSTCPKIVDGYNFVNNSANPMDDNGHGTHCAGIAAANGSIKGVAPGAKLLAYKVCNSQGSCNSKDIISGIQRAIKYNATVISMSFGSNEIYGKNNNKSMLNPYKPLQQAIKNATDQGIVVVMAAGNEGPGTGSISIDSISEDVISVGAVNKSDNLAADFTSIGPAPNGISKPDLVAPGVNINSTYFDGNYTIMSGTSMATPHVAGAVAILKQAHPNWSLSQIHQALMFTAKDLGKRPIKQGSGRINISAAINNTIWTNKNYLHLIVFAGGTNQTNLTITNNGDITLNLSIYANFLRADCETGNCNISISNNSINLSNNTIAPHSNQTINISVSLPNNTQPGTYTGVLYFNNKSVFPFTITVPAHQGMCVIGYKFKSYVDNHYNDSERKKTGDILHYPFYVARNGTNITILVNWTNSSNDIDLHLKFPNGSFYNQSLTATKDMPEKANITNATAGWYDLIINYWKGSGSENVTTTLSLINPVCFCANCAECEKKLNCSLCKIVYLINDINATGTCINNPANFSNKTLDCQGYKITGKGTEYGIYLDSKQNNTIRNCIISNFSSAIYLNSSSNNTLINNTIYNNDFGVYLSGSTFLTLSNFSSNNTLINNTIKQNNQTGIYLQAGSNNTLYSNNVCYNGLDINNTNTSNTGINSSCCRAQNYNDSNSSNCTYFCSGGCTPPNITIHNINNKTNASWLNSSEIVINFSAHQKENKSMNCTAYIDNGSEYNASVSNVTSGVARTINFSNLSDNNYTIYINCSTSAGLSNVSENWSFFLDTTPPIIAFDNSTPANGTRQTQTFINGSVIVNDTNLNITTIFLYKSGALLNSTNCSTTSCSFNFTNFINGTFINGTYYLNATAYDKAGNLNKTETRTIYIWSTCVDNDSDGFFGYDNNTCPEPYGEDCNDNNASINPNATEICNGVDDNCNNQTDEGVKNKYYLDADNDSFGNPVEIKKACSQPQGYVNNSQDCNDSNFSIHPGANEICGNGIDENCDGIDASCCGNGICEADKGESCSTCSTDCGSCSKYQKSSGGGGGGGIITTVNGTGKITYNLTYLTDLCAHQNITIKFPYSDFGVFLDGHRIGYTDREGKITFTTIAGRHSLLFIDVGNRQEYNIYVKDCTKQNYSKELRQELHIILPSQPIITGKEFTIYVVDGLKMPVENVSVTYGNQTKTTSKDGKASFIAFDGIYNITATKGKIVTSLKFASNKSNQANNETEIQAIKGNSLQNITCLNLIGICWYWWLLLIPLIIWIIWKFYLRRKDRRHIERILDEILREEEKRVKKIEKEIEKKMDEIFEDHKKEHKRKRHHKRKS